MGKSIVTIEPFRMDYLKDYFEEFNTEIAKYQWPDPFETNLIHSRVEIFVI